MPLRNPNRVPKIPKTRKRKAEAAFEAIPVKKQDKIEYKCKTYFNYDEVKKKQYSIISIETVIEFTSFAYSITTEVLKERNTINIIIMGLEAKADIISNIQPANTEIFFDNLIGDVTVNLLKQDGAINSAIFNYNKFNRKIKLVESFLPEKENNRIFCEFDVAKDKFSFAPKP